MPKGFLPLIALSAMLCACGEQKKAEDAVAQMASDPENVLFRDVTKSTLDDKTFCGEFRSKEGPSTWGEFKQFTSDGFEVLSEAIFSDITELVGVKLYSLAPLMDKTSSQKPNIITTLRHKFMMRWSEVDG
jgi:hypothetical protein